MGKFWKWIIIFLIYSVGFSGCIQSNSNVTSTSPNQTNAVSTTVFTPTATYGATQSSTVSYPGTNPIPTLLSTLEPDSKHRLISILFETNGFCGERCIWGMINGETPFSQSIAFLRTIDGGWTVPHGKYDRYIDLDEKTAIRIEFEDNNGYGLVRVLWTQLMS